MRRRTPEEVCIEYATVAGLIGAETAKIKPSRCERMASSEFRPGWPSNTTPIEPCISNFFRKRKPEEDLEEYREAQMDVEAEMCDQCTISLKAVRDRKSLRPRLGAAKRSVQAVGKRLQKAGE